MPLNNFYTHFVKSIDSGSLSAEIELNPEHPIYKGHFPNHPITPGVCLIEIFRQVFSTYVNTELKLKSAKDIKFRAPIIPKINQKLLMNIKYKNSLNEYEATCTFTSKDINFATIKGIFSAE